MEALILVATLGGPTLFARIDVMRTLNRHVDSTSRNSKRSFIPFIQLIITAADADHPSFGCRDKAKWTYFGNAFFNVALRQAKSMKDAFVVARALVQKRELREHFEPSTSPNGRRRKRAAVADCATLNDRPASPPTPTCAETVTSTRNQS
jgi:hypothetical protein